MASINSLAEEFGVQPHEVAAFADLGIFPQWAELDDDTIQAIREAWGTTTDED